MTPWSSDRVKFNTTYWGWLKAYSKYWFSMPIREAEELLEFLRMVGALLIYTMCFLSSPVTFPILALVIMVRSKKKMVKDHGEESLAPNDKD